MFFLGGWVGWGVGREINKQTNHRAALLLSYSVCEAFIGLPVVILEDVMSSFISSVHELVL